jgi:hypothetical protein
MITFRVKLLRLTHLDHILITVVMPVAGYLSLLNRQIRGPSALCDMVALLYLCFPLTLQGGTRNTLAC